MYPTHAAIDALTLSSWRGQLAATGPQRGLRAQLLRRRRELLPRFAAAYHYLCALSRRLRKAVQRRWGVSLAGVALLLTMRPLTGEAATFTARTAAELAAAITAANVASGADTITLKADITLTTVDNTTYGPTGLPVVSSALTIVGKGHTIRRPPSAPEFRLLAVNGVGNLTVQNATLSGGRAVGKESSGDLGGGIFNSEGEVTLEGCTVSGNTANGDGGGVFSFVYFSGGVTLTNSTVSGNSANGVGGGMSSRGGVDVTVALTNSRVSGNTAGSAGGGVYSCAALSTVTLMNSTVSGNTAGGDGGGVFNCLDPETGLEITNSTVSGNSAGGNGGGVYGYVVQDGLMQFTNSTVSGNTAGSDGGGIFGVAGIFAEMRLTNSTVSGNTAGSAGGGVFGIAAGSGRVAGGVLLDRSLFSGNLAPSGAEVFHDYSYGYGAFIVTHNLFGYNELTTAQALVGVPAGGDNIVATKDGTTPTALAAILDTTLQDNGGPTLTHDLAVGSPAIDAAGETCGLSTDQRGAPRPFGPACDIGAVEFEPADLPPLLLNDLVTLTPLSETYQITKDPVGCPAGFVGKVSFSERLMNKSTSPALSSLVIRVKTLSGGNLLQNAQGGPSRARSFLFVPTVGQYADEVLSPTEFVDVPFVICLKHLHHFNFKVDVKGVTQQSD